MICQKDNSFNDKQYWEKQFASCLERKMKLAQADFFYNCFQKMMPKKLCEYFAQNKYSCCDFGCGLGNFTAKLCKDFPSFDMYGVDFSNNAISYARENFPEVVFINDELGNLQNDYDVIVTSNTLEHFFEAEDVLQKLLNHTNKFFIMLVPYEERELYDEHLFNFERDFFKNKIGRFDLIYLSSRDFSCEFNTMWFGKQILAVYKSEDVFVDFSYTENLKEQNFNLIDKVNYKLNYLRRNIYRYVRKYFINTCFM